MSKHLVLIGGGHAHMVTLANMQDFIRKGYAVTVIQPSEYHYYSGMGPGMLGGNYTPDDIRFETRKLVEAKGGRFLLGKAYRVDPDNKTVLIEGSDEAISYDVLSCNAGSYVPVEMFAGEIGMVYGSKPIEILLEAREKILEGAKKEKMRVAVVGSGPSSMEIAGNVHQLGLRNELKGIDITIFAGRTFMSGVSARIRKIARRILQQKGITILETGYVQKIENGVLELEDGQRYTTDLVFAAVGVKPSKIFHRSGLPIGPDGGLRVNKYLQSTGYSNIFGGGDCVYFEPDPLDKVGVYAVRQNPVLHNNLMASLDGRSLETFLPGPKYLLIYNLGNGDGIISKWNVTLSGKWAFRVKDRKSVV